MAKKKSITAKNNNSESKGSTKKFSYVIHSEFPEETKRKILLMDKYTDGYIPNLKEFKTHCQIKKSKYSKEIAKYLELLHESLIAYRKAVSFMEENDPTRGVEYKKIIAFIEKELNTSYNEENLDPNNNVLLDLSNSSAVEKLICLNELGVLDFLKTKVPFNLSTNALAEALSAVTSEKPKTLQSALNAMFGKNVSKKNDPYKSHETVQKVKDKLINIGFTSN